MNIEIVSLEQCPPELQVAVQKQLSKYADSELFSVRMMDSPIYTNPQLKTVFLICRILCGSEHRSRGCRSMLSACGTAASTSKACRIKSTPCF